MSTTISPEVFDFFKALAKNNNREWFNDRKPQFKGIEADVKKTYNELFEMLKKHDDIDSLKMFRIYRDVRFSKNKAPYKTHFGGAFHRKKPALRGGYYLHIEPGGSFLGVGFWDPNKEDLQRIRKEFEMDATEIREILADKKLRSVWGELQGDELKTAPKGFDKEHPDIDLIRKKQYIFTKKYSDTEVLSEGFLTEVDDAFKIIRPYFNYMSEILTTDLNGVSLLD
jgi:uncharacterized protein (TIGR02453 family)